jgi:hypothetical protein
MPNLNEEAFPEVDSSIIKECQNYEKRKAGKQGREGGGAKSEASSTLSLLEHSKDSVSCGKELY